MAKRDDSPRTGGNCNFLKLTRFLGRDYGRSKFKEKAETVEKVAFVLKIILILVIIAGLIYGMILCYRKYGNRIKQVKMPKAVKKADSQPTFSVFKDEEATTTDAGSS